MIIVLVKQREIYWLGSKSMAKGELKVQCYVAKICTFLNAIL